MAVTRLRYITLVKIFRLKGKPGSYKYREFNIKTEQRTRVCMYETHVRPGVGNDILQISDMVHIEGTEIPGNLILNIL